MTRHCRIKPRLNPAGKFEEVDLNWDDFYGDGRKPTYKRNA